MHDILYFTNKIREIVARKSMRHAHQHINHHHACSSSMPMVLLSFPLVAPLPFAIHYSHHQLYNLKVCSMLTCTSTTTMYAHLLCLVWSFCHLPFPLVLVTPLPFAIRYSLLQPPPTTQKLAVARTIKGRMREGGR